MMMMMNSRSDYNDDNYGLSSDRAITAGLWLADNTPYPGGHDDNDDDDDDGQRPAPPQQQQQLLLSSLVFVVVVVPHFSCRRL